MSEQGIFYYIYIITISHIRTITLAPMATGKSPKPAMAKARATMKPSHPLTTEPVADTMAGNVITAKVTYGT